MAGVNTCLGGRSVILGGVLVHLCLGTLYTWGNLSVYVTSRLKSFHPSLTYADTIIVYGCQVGAQACFMYIGGRLEQRWGARWVTLLGCALVCTATFLAAAMTSLWSLCLCYGGLFGMGVGLAYTPPLVCGYKHYPQHKGLVSGFVVSGFGLGAFVFNQVASVIVNPSNLKADYLDRGELYFSAQSVVLSRVPTLFITLGAVYTVLMLLGSLLLHDPQYHHISGDSCPAKVEGEDGSTSQASSPRPEDLEEEEEAGEGQPASPLASLTGASPLLRQNGRRNIFLSRRLLLLCCPERGGEREEEEGEGEVCVRPEELVGSWQAWHVSICLMLGALGGLITLAVYKKAGLLSFNDDRFMALTGALASLGNAAGRLCWGALSDAWGPYRTLYALTLSLSLLFFTWALTTGPWHSKAAFAIWTVGICFCHGGNFACYPALVASLFGKRHVGPNFGLIFLPYGLLSLLGIALLPRLSLGLHPLNTILGGVALGSFVAVGLLAHAYPPRTTGGARQDGRVN